MTKPKNFLSSDGFERGILDLLSRRAPGKTICPSEVARALGGADWRNLMEPVRRAAWRLVASGRVVVLKGGQPVARDGACGPLRIGLRGEHHFGDPAAGCRS